MRNLFVELYIDDSYKAILMVIIVIFLSGCFLLFWNRIGGVMVSVLASSAAHRGFEIPIGSNQNL